MSKRKHQDSNDNAVDTLRLSDRAQHEIFSKMKHQAPQSGRVDRRNTERVDFIQTVGISVTIHHPGGSTVKYLVRPRNLSHHGMGFIHG